MIAVYRRGYGATTDYEIAWVTVTLAGSEGQGRSLGRMDPAHRDARRRLWTDVVRRAQPGYVAAPASLLALASGR